MIDLEDLPKVIEQMKATSHNFYISAVRIGNHPFIEFAGLMNEYIKMCEDASKAGIDFTECDTHSGKDLPMPEHSRKYINEKLECIFTGRSFGSNGNIKPQPRSQIPLDIINFLQTRIVELKGELEFLIDKNHQLHRWDQSNTLAVHVVGCHLLEAKFALEKAMTITPDYTNKHFGDEDGSNDG